MSIIRTSAEYATSDGGGERCDCSVRALSVAARMSYTEAYDILAKAGRVPRDGTPVSVSRRALEQLGYRPLLLHRGGCSDRARFPTLTQFIALCPTGRYIVHRRRHAFAVVDSVVHDWSFGTSGPRSRIIRAWRVS